MADFPEMPKFASVRSRVKDQGVQSWLDKLEVWCNEAVGAHARESSRADGLDRLLLESAEAEHSLRLLVEDLQDVERGIRTLDEVLRESVGHEGKL